MPTPTLAPMPVTQPTPQPAVQPAVAPQTSPTSSGALDPHIVMLAQAIRQTESGGNYSATGKSGEYGAYQFLPTTWATASQKYLGQSVPLSKATPQQQNEVAYKQLADWQAQNPTWNIGNFASAWNAGPGKPDAYKDGNVGTNAEGVKYDTPTYAKNVATAYQKIKAGQLSTSQQSQPTAPSANSNPDAGNSAPATSQPQGDLLSGASGILNTIFPNQNIGEAVGTELDKLFPNTFIPKAVAPSTSAAPTISGADQTGNIAPSTATVGGITGNLLQDAAWLVGGGEVVAPVEEASTLGRIGAGALAGAKAGAIGGSLSGAGTALANGGNLINAGEGALSGAAEGGAAGGVLGGALSAIPTLAGRIANRGVQSESAIADAATRANLGSDGALSAGTLGKTSAQFAKNANQADETAGQIVQGTKEDAQMAVPVLRAVNTAGVKTYEQLSGRIQDAIDAHQSTVNSELKSNPTPTKISKLGQKVSVGSGTTAVSRTVNYVQDAIDQLKQFYNKTGNVAKELGIEALEKKGKTTGLTPEDINNLAQQHGRDLNGYNANGELASGLSKQAAENTRTGLKTTARSFLSSDAAKNADLATSQLLKVKDQVDTVGEKVNNLAQKVVKRGLLQKAGRGIGKVVDAGTGGFLKSLFMSSLVDSNVGLKSMNYLDIQNRLARNLQILDRLNGSTDTDVAKFLRSVIGGLVTKR